MKPTAAQIQKFLHLKESLELVRGYHISEKKDDSSLLAFESSSNAIECVYFAKLTNSNVVFLNIAYVGEDGKSSKWMGHVSVDIARQFWKDLVELGMKKIW